MCPTIVISAYNRPIALRRLLSSLAKAVYPKENQTCLIISIDHGDDDAYQRVVEMAKGFQWTFGPKEVIEQKERLGLIKHVFFCCGLSQKYDEVIYLEDDLIVSPAFYAYCSQAFDFYKANDGIAAISLYGLWFNGYTQQPFIPLEDGTDVFFLQMPYTQGQAFTRSQWKNFSDWLASGDRKLSSDDQLHDSFFHFEPEEWFPLMAKYVVESGRYVVYPRVSLTSGAGDAGTHFKETSVFFQTPLQGWKDHYQFSTLDQSVSVYDSFFEILPDRLNRLTNALRDFAYDVDLYATKAPQHLRKDYVLTSRQCRSAVLSFGKSMRPMETNIIENVPGDKIFLCRKADLKWGWWSELATRKSNHDFFTRRRRMSRRLRLAFTFFEFLQSIKNLLRLS